MGLRKNVLCVVLVIILSALTKSEQSNYCYPGMNCYFSVEEGTKFAASLDGTLITPLSPAYFNLTIMKDLLVTRLPTYIILVESIQDVQKTMLFARKYNLRVTIQSSGHDYLGRSTADGSSQINLVKMNSIEIDLNSSLNPDGTVRVGSGNNWARVYEEVNKHGRIVLGGSAPTVAMGGYTLGGGHSPFSRMHGLGVDNLLEVTMVTTEGAIVNASANGTVTVDADGKMTHSSSPDLFWALRGGGGGTFGVVTHFVFKLHKPPSGFARVSCSYRFKLNKEENKAKEFLNFYYNLAKSLPNNWGGYLSSGVDFTITTFDTFYYAFSMLHYGPSTQSSFSKIQPLLDFHTDWQHEPCKKDDYATFWDYEKTTYDPLYTRFTLVNALIRPHDIDDALSTNIRDLVMVFHTNTSAVTCTNTLIGGAVSAVGHADTAVSPNLRSAISSLSCGLGWQNNPLEDHDNMAAAAKLEESIRKISHGVYLNEPPAIIDNWKQTLWGHNYGRLLKVKKQWDPTNFLTCLYCVGSDLGRNYTRQHNPGLVG